MLSVWSFFMVPPAKKLLENHTLTRRLLCHNLNDCIMNKKGRGFCCQDLREPSLVNFFKEAVGGSGEKLYLRYICKMGWLQNTRLRMKYLSASWGDWNNSCHIHVLYILSIASYDRPQSIISSERGFPAQIQILTHHSLTIERPLLWTPHMAILAKNADYIGRETLAAVYVHDQHSPSRAPLYQIPDVN